MFFFLFFFLRKELHFFFISTTTNYHEQGLAHLVSEWPSVREVPSLIHRCDLKSLPKWTKYNIYVRINLLSDIILLDDEVVPTSPICSSKDFLSNLECTLWKRKENGQVRQIQQRERWGRKAWQSPQNFCMEGRLFFPLARLPAAVPETAGARTHPPPPTPQKSSLDAKDQRTDQGDGGNRAYSPYTFYGTEWEKSFHNEKISKGFFGVNVLVTVLSKEERIPQGLYAIMQWNRYSEDTIGTEARVLWIEMSQRRGSNECKSLLTRWTSHLISD